MDEDSSRIRVSHGMRTFHVVSTDTGTTFLIAKKLELIEFFVIYKKIYPRNIYEENSVTVFLSSIA